MQKADALGDPPIPPWRDRTAQPVAWPVDTAVTDREQHLSKHPWADKWPTWPSL